MTGTSELNALAERCAKAAGPDREIDRAIQLAIRKAVPSDRWTHDDERPPQKPRHFTASLDSAMALVPLGSDYFPRISKTFNYRWRADIYEQFQAITWAGDGATPMLAICAAALKARAASGMSAGTAKTPQAVEGQSPASPVGEAETPKA